MEIIVWKSHIFVLNLELLHITPSKFRCISLWQSSGYVVQIVKFDGATSATNTVKPSRHRYMSVHLCWFVYADVSWFTPYFCVDCSFCMNFEASDCVFQFFLKCILLELMCNGNQITNRILKLLRVTCCFIWFSLHINSSKMHLLQEKLKNAASVYSWNNHLLQNSYKNYNQHKNYMYIIYILLYNNGFYI